MNTSRIVEQSSFCFILECVVFEFQANGVQIVQTHLNTYVLLVIYYAFTGTNSNVCQVYTYVFSSSECFGRGCR